MRVKMQRKEDKKVNNPFKRAVVIFVSAVVCMCLVITALVVYVDPFFHYHKPLKNFPYLVDNQLTQNPGMAEHMDYDSVILGSSMTVNFDTDWFYELMGLHTIKLSYSGAYPKDQSNIMKIIFDSDHEVKKVFLGVDVITYMGGVEETKYPIPEYLYDDNYINDIEYVLNKDVLLNYILRPLADPDPTDLSTVYKSWWTEEYYSKDWVLHNYVRPEVVEEEVPADEYIPGTEKNLAVNICPYIEENPDTRFVIFFPPYSILFWNDVLAGNHLEATLAEYRYITERLNAYDNVEIYFFPDREDIILDLNHYADYSHYHPDYNRFMTECFADGTTGLVAKEGVAGAAAEKESAAGIAEAVAGESTGKGKTIDEYLEHMREIALNYDFDALFE